MQYLLSYLVIGIFSASEIGQRPANAGQWKIWDKTVLVSLLWQKVADKPSTSTYFAVHRSTCKARSAAKFSFSSHSLHFHWHVPEVPLFCAHQIYFHQRQLPKHVSPRRVDQPNQEWDLIKNPVSFKRLCNAQTANLITIWTLCLILCYNHRSPVSQKTWTI